MNKRFTSLSFIIGWFFLLVALILLTGYSVSDLMTDAVNLYAGIAFLLFGLFMVSRKMQNDSE